MYRISIWVIFMVAFLIPCSSQKPYHWVKEIKPDLGAIDTMEFLSVICADCLNTGIPDSTLIRHNLAVDSFWGHFFSLQKAGWVFDSINNEYIASDSFLKSIRTTYFSFYYRREYKEFNLGINQNSSSPDSKFSKYDSFVGSIRYRVRCDDCPYPKRHKLYYLFCYNKDGIILKHGLAYLRQRKRIKN